MSHRRNYDRAAWPRNDLKVRRFDGRRFDGLLFVRLIGLGQLLPKRAQLNRVSREENGLIVAYIAPNSSGDLLAVVVGLLRQNTAV